MRRAGAWAALGFTALGVAALGCGNSSSTRAAASAGSASSGAPGASAAAGTETNQGGSTAAGGKGGAAAGSSTAGAGPAGGAEAQGGDGAAGAPEPPQLEPDLTDLVPTSNQWLLFNEYADVIVGTGLTLLDLASGERHPANPDELPLSTAGLSPDGRQFAFSGQGDTLDENLAMIRFAKTGFVPAKPLIGFSGELGSYIPSSWDEHARFFTVTRFGAKPGIEVVDGVLGKRVGHVVDGSAFVQGFAPKGPYFAYFNGGQSYSGEVASVTADGGIGTPFKVSDAKTRPIFSADGKHLYFTTQQGDVKGLSYIDLPDATPKQLPNATPGESIDRVFAGGAASAFAWVERGGGLSSLVQVFFDGRARVDVSEPSTDISVWGTFVSTDQTLVSIDYWESLELVQLEPFKRFPLVGKTVVPVSGPSPTGMVGRYLYYQRDGLLRVATVDAPGALVDAAVSDAGETPIVCNVPAGVEPLTKLAFHDAAYTELAIVDMAARPPAVVLRYSASTADATVQCPHWQHDGKAFLLSEKSPSKTRAYVSNWAGAQPTTPKLALESDQVLRAFAFSY